MAPLNPNDIASLANPGATGMALTRSPVGFFESLDVSFDLAIVSDYRRAGVSRSGNAPAIQGSFDISSPSGWSIGADAASIDTKKGGHYEASFYVSKSFTFGETELSIGATAVLSPDLEHEDFGVAQASVSRPIGPIDATLAVNYAWEQDNLDGEDSIYVVARARTPIGRLAGAPLTLAASIGRADGELAIEDTRMDWSLSLVTHFHGADLGVSYVDTDIDDERGDPTLVFSIRRSF